MNGWAAPPLAPWLKNAFNAASQTCFGKNALYAGSGGTIPFLGMLGELFPNAQLLVTGVCGPGSNMHAADENLSLSYVKKLTCAVAQVLRRRMNK